MWVLCCAVWSTTLDLSGSSLSQRLNEKGKQAVEKGNLPAAKSAFLVAIHEAKSSNDSESLAVSLTNLGQVYLEMKMYARAEATLKRAEQEWTLAKGTSDINLAVVWRLRGMLCEAQKKFECGEEFYRQALTANIAGFGPSHPNVALSLSDLAIALGRSTRLQEASELLERALRIDNQHFGEESERFATDLHNLGSILWMKHEYDKAEAVYRKALRIRVQKLGTGDSDTALTMSNLAITLEDLKRLPEAESLYREALAVDRRIFVARSERVRADISNLNRVLRAQGNARQSN